MGLFVEGPKPKIERVEMNGQNRLAIVSRGVQWPNGLALDYDTNRIFWADAMCHVIESSDLDGNNRTVVSVSTYKQISRT